MPENVFISYAHKDESFKKRLLPHFAVLREEGMVDNVWHDRVMTAGTNLDTITREEIQHASIIVLLVSPFFFASEYCMKAELPAALDLASRTGAVVVPVIVRPVGWHGSIFGKLLALPTDGKPITAWSNRDRAYFEIEEGLRSLAQRSAHKRAYAEEIAAAYAEQIAAKRSGNKRAYYESKAKEHRTHSRAYAGVTDAPLVATDLADQGGLDVDREAVVLLLANNFTSHPLRLEKEVDAIKYVLSAPRSSFNLAVYYDLHAQDFGRIVDEHRPDVIHYTGIHDRHLLPTSDETDPNVMDGLTVLAKVTELQQHLPLLYLDTCIPSNLVTSASQACTSAIIVGGEYINDASATAFAKHFYQNLVMHRNAGIQAAFSKATTQRRMEFTDSSGELYIPQLIFSPGADSSTMKL